MNLEVLEYYAKLKGLNLLGTGDFTYSKWLNELKEQLIEEDFGIYIRRGSDGQVRFLVQTEVNTVFEVNGKVRRVHHVIFVPSLEVAEQVNESLAKYGDLNVDGRPTLKMDGATLVEEVLSVDDLNIVFPAHAWTPWYSIFGSRGGVDKIEQCYGDKSKEVFALETGLSSDPPMNWRISALDRLTLLSNSDSHSPWPWRLGREANVFELRHLNYLELYSAIRDRDRSSFLMTIEVDPAYGKYHWSGHRACGVSMPPSESISLKGICPVCGKKMTKGVAERVEELADRPEGFQPEKAIPFKHVLPLSEILSAALNKPPESREVWDVYMKLVKSFGNELHILLEAPLNALKEKLPPLAYKLLEDMRENKLNIKPGYDGVYGQLIVGEREVSLAGQFKLEDFIA